MLLPSCTERVPSPSAHHLPSISVKVQHVKLFVGIRTGQMSTRQPDRKCTKKAEEPCDHVSG